MTLMDARDEDALLERAKAGDLDAFECLYQRYLPVVHRRVCFVIPEDDVEDVTQEVFIAVVKSLSGFRGEARFSTWLRTLTNRKVAEYYRRRSQRRLELQVDAAEARLHQGASMLTTSVLEERIALRSALCRLSKRHREIILLRFAEGLPFDQIAEVLGLNLEAAKSLFRRAVCALREHLDR